VIISQRNTSFYAQVACNFSAFKARVLWQNSTTRVNSHDFVWTENNINAPVTDS